MYVDDKTMNTQTQSQSITTVGGKLVVGWDCKTQGRWTGGIDDLRVYSRVLPSDEIYQVFVQRPPNSNGLLRHLPISHKSLRDFAGMGAFDVAGTVVAPEMPMLTLTSQGKTFQYNLHVSTSRICMFCCRSSCVYAT
jgi:hypothetical protein